MSWQSFISTQYPESLSNLEIGDVTNPRIGGECIARNEINLLILHYLIYEGYVNAAGDFAKELGFKQISKQLQGETPDPIAEDAYDDSDFDEKDVDSKYLDVGTFFTEESLRKDYEQALDEIGCHDEDAPTLTIDKYRRLTSGLPTIKSRNEIKLLILNGKMDEAIELINQKFPSLLESNQYIYFRLLHLDLIEKIRTHFNTDHDTESDKQFLADVLEFIRTKLSAPNVLQSKKFLKELEFTMALLCFGDKLKCADDSSVPKKLRDIVDPKVRSIVANLVNRAIIIHSNPVDTVGGSEDLDAEQYEIKATDFDRVRDKKESDDRGTSSTSIPSLSTAATENPEEILQETRKDSEVRQVGSELEALETRLKRTENVRLLRLVKFAIWTFSGYGKDGDGASNDGYTLEKAFKMILGLPTAQIGKDKAGSN